MTALLTIKKQEADRGMIFHLSIISIVQSTNKFDDGQEEIPRRASQLLKFHFFLSFFSFFFVVV